MSNYCIYCIWTNESHHFEDICEGRFCEEAKENYLDELYLLELKESEEI